MGAKKYERFAHVFVKSPKYSLIFCKRVDFRFILTYTLACNKIIGTNIASGGRIYTFLRFIVKRLK